MTAPLFSVNEEVIVVSDHFGRFESRIIRARYEMRAGFDCVTGAKMPPEFDYWLDPSTSKGFPGKPWPESRLRKKPHPSSQSFDEIMQSIKRPVRVPA